MIFIIKSNGNRDPKDNFVYQNCLTVGEEIAGQSEEVHPNGGTQWRISDSLRLI